MHPRLVPAAVLLASALACGPPRGSGDAGAVAPAPSAEGVHREVRKLADGVYTYEYAPAGDPVTTVSFVVVGSEGVLVADGQGSLEETGRLVAAVARLTSAPITHVIVASDHGDHTGGNGAFPPGVAFLAHPATRAALAATAARPDRAADAPPVVMPTRVVDGATTVALGDRRVRVLFLGRGHTAGDLAVHDPDSRTLFMSEAYNDRVFPLLRTGYPSEWVAVLKAAEAMDVDRWVAGHGVRGSVDYGRGGIAAYRAATELVIAEAKRLHAEGVSADDAFSRADFGALERWADYASQAPRALRRVYLELEGGLSGG